MSQEDIVELLKTKRKKWLTSKEMSKMLKINKNTITRALSSLRKTDFIKYQTAKRGYQYRYA